MIRILFLAIACYFAIPASANPDCGSTNPGAPCTGTTLTTTDSGTTFTWTVDCGGVCQMGRFLNGDPWVRHPSGGNVSITNVTPDGANSGLEKNPATGVKVNSPSQNEQGLLACAVGDSVYQASLDLSNSLPINAPPDNGVYVKVEAYQGGDCGYTSQVGSCCVDGYSALTVVQNIPAVGAVGLGSDTLRPPMSGDTKQFLTKADFDLSSWPARSEITDAADFTIISTRWRSPYADFYTGFDGDRGRRWAPRGRQADYKAQQTQTALGDLYSLMGPAAVSGDKEAAIYAILQYGWDVYGAYLEGVEWVGGAGQHQGYWHPFVLLGTLTTNGTIQTNVKMAPAGANTWDNGSGVQFMELYQISRNMFGTAVWGGMIGQDGCIQGSFNGTGRYWTDYTRKFRGQTGKGKGTCGDPYRFVDGTAEGPGRHYASCCSGALYGLMGLLMKIWPEFNRTANYPPMLEFADRVMDGAGWYADKDLCARYDPRENASCDPYTTTTAAATCNYFGVSWGHNSSNNFCITIPEAIAAGHTDPRPRFYPEEHLQGVPVFQYGDVLLKQYWPLLTGP